jgi:hypothetical protein
MREDMPFPTGQHRRGRWSAFWKAGIGILWVGAVATGLSLLARYDNKPGEAARAPSGWPAASRIARDPIRPTLVMLAHPRCTCTRASLAELTEVMTRAAVRPRAYVVFIKPGGVAADWEMTDLWNTASAIPDVTVLRDDEGIEAARFGAATSGQTFLYAPDGHLLFSGGTTGARGHAGDNMGRATILAILNHQSIATIARSGHSGEPVTPVFGCPLFALHAEREDPSPVTSHGHHGN